MKRRADDRALIPPRSVIMTTTTDRNTATAICAAIRRLRSAAAVYGAHIVLAVFLIIGVAIVDDYGVSVDEGRQRGAGFAYLDYVLGKNPDGILNLPEFDRYYGVAFTLPLSAVERVLRLEDTRAVYLSRHLLTHIFFLVGGFFVWMLAHRMFGNRILALFAMLLFLLHPRTYGESFFNSKDLPFLSMFAISLYLIHRAFRRDTVWSFALCGVGIGLLVNMRILGLMPFAAVLGMLALDAVRSVYSSGVRSDGARRVFANGAAFSLAAVLTLYAAWPLVWGNPAELPDAFWTMARHPPGDNLFHGEMIRAPNIPWFYMPEWIFVSVPPVALALALAGASIALFAGAARWRSVWRNSPERFALALVAFAIAPIAAVIALNSHVYDGWRHMYFIYAPMCLLAALALERMAAALRSMPRLRMGVYALAAASIALVAVQMVRLHPYQFIYFNAFASGRENLGETYEMDYWGIGRREALEWLLDAYPDRHMIVRTDLASRWDLDRNLYIIPEEDRRRVSVRAELPHFHITDNGDNPAWSREIYGVPIVSVVDTRAETEAAYRDAYARARESEPIARADFDAHLDGDTLIYVKEPCAEEDTRGRFLLSVVPIDAGDLPESARELGHESLNFDFKIQGAMFDGKCAIMVELPTYPIARIELGQWIAGGADLWMATAILDDSVLAEYRRAYSAALESEPVARAGFDVYWDGGALTYVKDPCAAEDARGRFLLSVVPKSQDDLPEKFRELGHESLNFDFGDYGAAFDGKCVVIRALPDYPIASVETGQWIPGGDRLWTAEFGVESD